MDNPAAFSKNILKYFLLLFHSKTFQNSMTTYKVQKIISKWAYHYKLFEVLIRPKLDSECAELFMKKLTLPFPQRAFTQNYTCKKNIMLYFNRNLQINLK